MHYGLIQLVNISSKNIKNIVDDETNLTMIEHQYRVKEISWIIAEPNKGRIYDVDVNIDVTII